MDYLQDDLTRSAKITNMELTVIKSNPMYRRQQLVRATGGMINGLEEDYYKYGQGAFNNELMTKVAPDLVRYSDSPTEEIMVPYGWGTERLSFEITVESEDAHSVFRSIIKGFTDKFEMSYTNRLDDMTTFFVDSVINTSRSIDVMTGALSPERIVSAYSVMSDPMTGVQGLYMDMERMQHVAIRPEDIILGIAANTAQQGSSIPTGVLQSVTGNATPAKVKDLNPMNNIGEVLSSLSSQMSNTDFNVDPTTAIIGALGNSVEYRVDDQPFFKRMSQVMFSSRIGQFTLGELYKAFGDISHLTTLIQASTGVFQMDGDSSGTVSVEAGLANMFLDASLSYLRKYGIVDIGFTITNLTLDGSTQNMIISAPGTNVESLNITALAVRAVNEIAEFAFPLITSNRFALSITMNISKTDALISLEFEGRNVEQFSFPLLAYSLSAPIIGTRTESDNIVQAVSGLSDLIITSGVDNGQHQQILY